MQLESAKYLEDVRQAGRTVLEGTAERTLERKDPRERVERMLQIPELMQRLMGGK